MVATLSAADGATFNYEIEERIVETLYGYFDQPVKALGVISKFRDSQVFEHGMQALDRDEFLKIVSAIAREYDFDIYFGREDGTMMGVFSSASVAYYREPGNSGYSIDSAEMRKYFLACVGIDGTPEACVLPPESYYVECVDGCALQPCPDQESLEQDKWCYNYVIKTTVEGEIRGYVPNTHYCLNMEGNLSQTPGEILKDSNGTLGDCYFEDGTTLVDRLIISDYAVCGGQGQMCSTAFTGGFESANYDPRWRSWYTETKSIQRPMWSAPYPFFNKLDMGITYSRPIYSLDGDKSVFQGVLAADTKRKFTHSRCWCILLSSLT
jgi:hypothetical protein